MSTLSLGKVSARIFAAVLAVVTLAPALHAQDLRVGGIVNVPFAFETGYQRFAAGVYTICMESPNIMSIHGASDTGLVMTRPGGDPQPAKRGKVVFRRTGGKYFLGEVWIAEKSGHQDILKSKAERQLQIAGNKTVAPAVEISMLETSH
jgi:hypothetical protein